MWGRESPNRVPAVVTLTTDFGLSDSYSAQLKGVILQIAPFAIIIDVTHQVPAFNVVQAALILRDIVPYYPDRTVHIGVVDPGVGGERRRVIVDAQYEGKRAFFVGPDNGIFSLAVSGAHSVRVFEIQKKRWQLPDSGRTFDGRDWFAPTAALLSSELKPELFGRPLVRLRSLDESGYVFSNVILGGEGSSQLGEIVYFDSFGNAVTNLKVVPVPNTRLEVAVDGIDGILPVVETYEALGDRRSVGCIINSQRVIEISVREGSAKSELPLSLGARVVLTKKML